jgi:hypothetical protein
LKKFFFFFVILFFLPTELIQGQENASHYLDSFTKKYSGLKDYTANVRVHFDIEALKAPDMQAKLYYKSPDKMRATSKGIFFFPRQGGYLNPSMFKPEDFDVRLLEHLTLDGRKAVRLQLTPKEMKRDNQRFVVTIEIDRNLIIRIDTLAADGREIRAAIDYGKFGDFELPTYIELQLDVPPAETNETKEPLPFAQRGKRVTGKIEIAYSNYKVNSGLSDDIFMEIEPHQSY